MMTSDEISNVRQMIFMVKKNINSTKVIVFMNYGFGLFLLLQKVFVDEVNNTQACGSQGLVWNENIVYIECLIRISVYLFCLYWF